MLIIPFWPPRSNRICNDQVSRSGWSACSPAKCRIPAERCVDFYPSEYTQDAFASHPKIARTLGLLADVGLGYLELGQPLTTLSGGEGQRLKLARELLGGGRERTLYLLDEPTRGLHPQDVEHFLALLDRLVDAGNTVVAVEHDHRVLCASDWVIDLGPGGGYAGGRLVFAGTPAALAAHGTGVTAACLRRTLGR